MHGNAQFNPRNSNLLEKFSFIRQPLSMIFTSKVCWRSSWNSNFLYYLHIFYKLIGYFEGLKSSTIRVVNIEDANKTCHITDELGTSDTLNNGMVIDGNILRINEILTNPMMINETFQFFIRAIGSQHVQQQRDDQFDGVAVFVLEQNQKTIGVFSANSPTAIWVKNICAIIFFIICSFKISIQIPPGVPPVEIWLVWQLCL